MEEKVVILVGNLTEGFDVIGPFNSFDEAADFDNVMFDGSGWIMPLTDKDDVEKVSDEPSN